MNVPDFTSSTNFMILSMVPEPVQRFTNKKRMVPEQIRMSNGVASREINEVSTKS
jgi:hypothetical protein